MYFSSSNKLEKFDYYLSIYGTTKEHMAEEPCMERHRWGLICRGHPFGGSIRKNKAWELDWYITLMNMFFYKVNSKFWSKEFLLSAYSIFMDNLGNILSHWCAYSPSILFLSQTLELPCLSEHLAPLPPHFLPSPNWPYIMVSTVTLRSRRII